MNIFKKFFKDPNKKVVEEIQPIVDQINDLSEKYEKMDESGLKKKTEELKEQLKTDKSLDEILVPAFAAVREANRRAIGVRHYDVQLVGGVVLHRGEIAEMKTGEGKTHVAALALYLNALTGKGAHLITVNDYLAKRDAGWNGAANSLLGMSTACIVNQTAFIYDPEYQDENQSDKRLIHLRPCTRKEAYEADITYGTNSEFGFDFLRDNMASDLKSQVQKELNFAIVDEVDSVLIDEARTPLIISAPAGESANLYQRFASLVPQLKENKFAEPENLRPGDALKLSKEIPEEEQGDYNIDEKMKTVTLTDKGISRVEKMLGMGNIYTEGGIDMVHHLEQALKAHVLFKKDRDYVVKDGEVVIIDEFTGRLMQGRRYSEGLHQAIEAKEGVEIKKESRTLATITIQNYFRMYNKLSGMTGTAATEAEEFAKIYSLDVTVVPTNKSVIRQDLSDRIYSTEKGKFSAVVQEIKRLHEKGQPVLVGTISIERNELLSKLLNSAGVPHELLNAKNHEKEANIIRQAGRAGAVTVATNMAGRGVDIKLGGEPFNQEDYNKVLSLGGLFVLGTERHESRRIDNQLRGRSGRQGDPGASQFYVSMEDDLMRVFGSDRIKGVMQSLGVPEDQPIENKMISNALEKAQKRVEGHNFDMRKHLVEYDDVINKQREVIYEKRHAILTAAEKSPEKSKEMVWEMIENEIEQVVSFHTSDSDQTKWNMREISEVAGTIFPFGQSQRKILFSLEKIAGDDIDDAKARTQIIEYLLKVAKEEYENLEQRIEDQSGDKDNLRIIEREILLRSIDNLWVDHLDAVNALRSGIGLRGYGQRDPLVEYKKETYRMFMQLQNLIQKQVVYSIYKIGQVDQMKASIMQQQDLKTSDIKSGNSFGGVKDPFAQTKKNDSAKPIKSKPRDASGKKVGRNDPCPCGSGKKYKNCCG